MNELVAELVRLRPWTWTDPDQCEFPFVFDPTLGNEARQVDYPTRVLLGRKFFDLPESTRWATAFHEVGHVLSDMGLVDGWAWDLVDLLPSWGHLNGQTTPGEVAAEAWSIWNTEPSFLLENAPGIAAVMDEMAPAAGFPRVASALPDVDFSVASEPQWGSARCRLSPMRDGRVALSQLTSTARGNGDGGQLVRLIAEQAAAQGITLVLDTVEPRLVSWYEELGFHETWRDADYEEWVRMEKTAGANPYATQPTGTIYQPPVQWEVWGVDEEGDDVLTRVDASTAYQAAEKALLSKRVVTVTIAEVDGYREASSGLKWTSPGAGTHRAILSDEELDRYQVESVPGSAYGSGVEWHLTYPGSSYPDDVFDRLRDAKDAAAGHYEQRQAIVRRQASLSIGFLD